MGRRHTPLDRKRDWPVTARFTWDEREHLRRKAIAHDVGMATYLYALAMAAEGQPYGHPLYSALRDILARLPKRLDDGDKSE